MFRIVCPFCHTPLSLKDLEPVKLDERTNLVCPECECVLVTEGQDNPRLDEALELHAHA